LSGLHTTTLSSWDQAALSSALEQMFHSHYPLSTSFTYSADSSGQGTHVEFLTYVPTELFGLDGLDPDNLHAAFQIAADVLSKSVTSGSFVTIIDSYLSQHQHDGHQYELFNHGLVQLLSVHEESYWRNYFPESYPPSSIPTVQLSATPSPAPQANSTGQSPAQLSSSSSPQSSSTSSAIPVPLIIGFFVLCGVVLIFYLNRSSSSSSHQKKSKQKAGKKVAEVYNELSTSSHHRGADPLYGDDNEDEEDDENQTEEEEDDLEAFSFTECVEDHKDEFKTKKIQKKSSSSRREGAALVPASANNSASSQLLKSNNRNAKPGSGLVVQKKSKKMKSPV
jgi:hypothetical protein